MQVKVALCVTPTMLTDYEREQGPEAMEIVRAENKLTITDYLIIEFNNGTEQVSSEYIVRVYSAVKMYRKSFCQIKMNRLCRVKINVSSRSFRPVTLVSHAIPLLSSQNFMEIFASNIRVSIVGVQFHHTYLPCLSQSTCRPKEQFCFC
jgi:hypothetical protein